MGPLLEILLIVSVLMGKLLLQFYALDTYHRKNCAHVYSLRRYGTGQALPSSKFLHNCTIHLPIQVCCGTTWLFGASLSEPHISMTSLRCACVCVLFGWLDHGCCSYRKF